MKWYRIWAVAWRHLQQIPVDAQHLTNVFYYPILDTVIFGMVGFWLGSGATQEPQILLTGLVLSQVITWRSSIGFASNFIDELWSRNITNIFATPLTLMELLISSMVVEFLISVWLIIYCDVAIYLIYDYHVLSIGPAFVLLWFAMFFVGIVFGIICTAALLRWGQRIQALIWALPWGFTMISGTLYPISILPPWLQIAAKAFPMSYVSSTMTALVQHKPLPWNDLMAGYLLNALYLFVGVVLVLWAFRSSKKRGLARLMD